MYIMNEVVSDIILSYSYATMIDNIYIWLFSLALVVGVYGKLFISLWWCIECLLVNNLE